MMDIVITETSVIIYQTTWRNIPQDSYLHTHRREDLQVDCGPLGCDAVVL
jgi:hypothetical protein